MEHYVTLFDGNFLPQGLALSESLERHAGDHVLWVLCLDDCARQALDDLANPNLRTIPLTEVETSELLVVKPERSHAEYYWTLTPFAPHFVFARDASVKRVTYLDADLFLLKSPRPIFDFLTFEDREWMAFNSSFQYLNRLRHSEYLAMHERAGLEIVEVETYSEDLPSHVSCNLAERYRAFGSHDLKILHSRIISRRT